LPKTAVLPLLVFLAVGARAQTGYVNPKLCAACHSTIYGTYQKTGMGRSFSKPALTPVDIASERGYTYYHEASDMYFEMEVRADNSYYQRRYQMGFDGSQTNIEEKRIDLVMGSGNHARTFLHQTPRGTLEVLPLGWYAEGASHWGMNPGYDRPDHPGSRRAVTYECMFCHNAYPAIPAGPDTLEAEPVFTGDMPLGIDCQRCHGPGGPHVRAAQAPGAKPEEIRSTIVNPARLPAARRMEVCLQCHLETTSFLLPHSVLRYGRGPFSYSPGQPLADFLIFFDHAPAAGKGDKFEIAGAAYRLRKSACFQKSNGALQCTTCHNPHDVPRGDAAVQHYIAVCRQCHTAGGHTAQGNCVGCHMPRQRTDDVIHVAMTDHFIRNFPVHTLMAETPERHETEATAYRGEVVPYYPQPLPKTAENELYTAIAQVRQQNNLRSGVARLSSLLAARPSTRPEPYLELGDAWRNNSEPGKAVASYEAALRRRPDWAPALRKLAAAQEAAGQPAQAIAALRKAVQLTPADPDAWHELGQIYLRQGRIRDAVAALQKALSLNPEIPEAHNSVGVLLAQGHDPRAESAFREAIRISPEYVEARTNLASLLPDDMAVFEFERAIRIQPSYAPAHLAYGEMLNGMRRYDEARQQLEACIQADPNLAEAHELLGVVLERRGRENEALAEYEAALRLRPDFARAHLDVAYVLERRGDVDGAVKHLREAVKSSDATTRDLATGMLKKLGR